MWQMSYHLQHGLKSKLPKHWTSHGFTWKGIAVISRLCVRGFKQCIKDLHDTFASTPVLMILQLRLVFAFSVQRSSFTFDITTAFLHAILNPDDDPILVWPPAAYFSNTTLVWKLKAAVYGLRTAPREWQNCFAEAFQKLGFRRVNSDGNVCVHKDLIVIMLVYVDGLMVLGEMLQSTDILKHTFLVFFVAETDNLYEDGANLPFI